MIVCPRCGVRLAGDATHCPLCRGPVEHIQNQPSAEASGSDTERDTRYTVVPPGLDDFEHLPAVSRNKIAAELFTVCSAIACAVVISVDLFGDGKIFWSLFPVASIAYLVSTVLSLGMIRRHPAAGYTGQVASIVLFLAILDWLTGGPSWFWPGAVAMVVSVEVPVLVVALAVRAMKKKGVNVIAVILAGLSAVCIGLELSIEYGLGTTDPRLDWSLIVSMASLPIAILLVYLHYRVTSQSSLAKLFHL